MSMDEMLKDFKELAEVKAFAEAQTRSIIDLNKKNRELQEEVLHLKKILEDSTGIIQTNNNDVQSNLLLGEDEETIAKVQINRLKEISFARELTLEESRRLEIFVKVLNIVKNKPAKVFEMTKSLGNEELLKLVDESPSG
jgi:hypothetical protein